MGTHPIFESDFDCLTDCTFRVSFRSIKINVHGEDSPQIIKSCTIWSAAMRRFLVLLVIVAKFGTGYERRKNYKHTPYGSHIASTGSYTQNKERRLTLKRPQPHYQVELSSR